MIFEKRAKRKKLTGCQKHWNLGSATAFHSYDIARCYDEIFERRTGILPAVVDAGAAGLLVGSIHVREYLKKATLRY